MRRDEIDSLHFIAPLSNLPSILEHGILSHRAASKHPHVDVSMAEVQDIRASKRIPGAGKLHDYANLYVHARNPMMFVRRAEPLCVVKVSLDVVDLPGVIVADGNAASGYTAFRPGSAGIEALDGAIVLAEYWTDNDYYAYLEKKRCRCAEVLVPNRVPPEMILAVVVPSETVRRAVVSDAPGIVVTVDPHLFFA